MADLPIDITCSLEVHEDDKRGGTSARRAYICGDTTHTSLWHQSGRALKTNDRCRSRSGQEQFTVARGQDAAGSVIQKTRRLDAPVPGSEAGTMLTLVFLVLAAAQPVHSKYIRIASGYLARRQRVDRPPLVVEYPFFSWFVDCATSQQLPPARHSQGRGDCRPPVLRGARTPRRAGGALTPLPLCRFRATTTWRVGHGPSTQVGSWPDSAASTLHRHEEGAVTRPCRSQSTPGTRAGKEMGGSRSRVCVPPHSPSATPKRWKGSAQLPSFTHQFPRAPCCEPPPPRGSCPRPCPHSQHTESTR